MGTLMISYVYMCMGVGKEEGLCFDVVFWETKGRLVQCLYHAYLEIIGDPLKHGGLTNCCTQQLSRGFWNL